MNVLILGATGRTGRQLVAEALQRGHIVKVLVRDKNKLRFDASRVIIVEGTPANRQTLADAMQGCDAILSALNISRKSDLPWSALRTPKGFLSAVMKDIVDLAPQCGIRRIIITSAWGVAETRADIPGWFRWFIDNSNIAPAYLDHGLQENILKDMDLDWTIVRPAGLTNFNNNSPVKVSFGNSPKPSLTITRKAVAQFMLDCLENSLYIKRLPTISQ